MFWMGNFLKIEDFDRQRGSSGMWGTISFMATANNYSFDV